MCPCDRVQCMHMRHVTLNRSWATVSWLYALLQLSSAHSLNASMAPQSSLMRQCPVQHAVDGWHATWAGPEEEGWLPSMTTVTASGCTATHTDGVNWLECYIRAIATQQRRDGQQYSVAGLFRTDCKRCPHYSTQGSRAITQPSIS